MKRRRVLAAILLPLLALSLAGCEPEQGGSGEHETKPRVDAGQ